MIGVYRPTTHDDDAEYYRDLLHAEMLATRENAGDDAYVARNEAETIEIIEALGDFHLFYSGVEEPAWLNQTKR